MRKRLKSSCHTKNSRNINITSHLANFLLFLCANTISKLLIKMFFSLFLRQHTIDTLKYQLSQGNAESLTEQLTSGVNLFNRPNGQQPSLAECEAVIKRLQHINEQQQHELERLKSDLRDVLYSHKWTPDAYLLAKAYVAEDDARADGKEKALPKLPYKNQSRKL